jgi:hypothetical protein
VTYAGSELGRHRDSYPAVAEWLEGADPGHWWARLLDVPRDLRVIPPTVEDMALGPMEVLVRAVRGASPKGMSLFIASRFRDPDLANVLSARLELLCAANLAACRVPFAFGGKGEPDLMWNPGTGAQGWLEIHRGAFSVFDDLQQELDRELDDKGAILRVRLGEWPLEEEPERPAYAALTCHRCGTGHRAGTASDDDGAGARCDRGYRAWRRHVPGRQGAR